MAMGISVLGYSSGLFRSEIELYGEYADKIHFLKDLGLFNSFRDAYFTAALIGFVNGSKKGLDIKATKDQSASIFPSDLSSRLSDLTLAYRLIMLTDESEDFTDEEYANRAFRDDSDDGNIDNLKKNMALFNSYACGGLDILFDLFKDVNHEDDVADSLYEFVNEFVLRANLGDGLEDLPEVEPGDDY